MSRSARSQLPKAAVAAQISLRNASERDLPAIIDLERLCFDNPWSVDSFSRELNLPFSRVVLAVASMPGRLSPLAGYLCRWLVADECHILNVAVHPRMRRHGIGTMLMKDAISEAQVKSAHVVTLEVRRSNLAARSLYRHFNFVERRLRNNYYGPGEDAIVMELKL